MVHGNLVKNFTITVSNINTTEQIFGPGIASLKRKLRRKPEQVRSN